jgi:hypothetical protein
MKLIPPTPSELTELEEWLNAQNGVPANITDIWQRFLKLAKNLLTLIETNRALVDRLREAMGIAPKSERGSGISSSTNTPDSKDDADGTDDEVAPLAGGGESAKITSEMAKYKKLIARLRKQLATLKKQNRNTPPRHDPEFQRPDEDLIRDPIVATELVSGTLRVTAEQKVVFFARSRGGFHSTYDHVTRFELKMILVEHRLRIETVTDINTGRSLRVDINVYGPAGSKITWTTVAKIMQLAVEYCMPIERIVKMLGRFSGKTLFNWLRAVAVRLLPIYLYLAEELAEARYLSLDDSPTKVLEIIAKLKEGTYGGERDDELDPLVLKTAAALGRAFERRNGKKPKKLVNVSLIHGRADINDPLSYIVFYRTHTGSTGNVLSKILALRRRQNKRLHLQCDMSTTNKPDAPYELLFEIIIAACMVHGRRDFWRYKGWDEQLCGKFLRAFALLSYVEHLIDARGRTKKNILRYRSHHSARVWKIIRKIALSVVNAKGPSDCRGHHFWPKTSKIYKACAYIIDHYEALTLYLTDPHLALTNNTSERLLRPEKMLLVSCKFRLTEHGRVVFDILRTFLMTCRTAQVCFPDYLRWVHSFPAQIIERDPAQFTPRAYREKLHQNSMPKSA